MNQKSFTLIEILVVIVVIGILSSFILVGMSSITSKANIAKGIAFNNSLNNILLIAKVSQWKLDEATGSTLAVDSWGINTGTVTGAVFKNSGCVLGNCLSYTGVNYVDCGNNNSLTFELNDFTISAWLYPEYWAVNGEYSFLYRYKDGTNDNGYDFELNVSGTDMYRVAAYTIETTSPGYRFMGNTSVTINKNAWSYISASRIGTSISWYINGVKTNTSVSTPIGTNFNSTSNFMIGKTAWGPTHQYLGVIDDVRIYNAAIPISRIQQNYFLGLNGLYKNQGITLNDFNQRLVELKNNITEK